MKISPVRLLNYQKPLNVQKVKKPANISFGAFNGNTPNDIQLYRCIGEEEYQKLINNEEISSSGFATSDSRGWGATDWIGGFMPYNKDYRNYYFITFKKQIF